jgi:hypothetical protein
MVIEKRKNLGIATTAMTENEAKECTNNIKSYGRKLQREILDFDMRKGFEILGYGSFKEGCEAIVTNISYDTLNNALNAAKITLDMAGIDLVGRYSPWALAPLKNHSYRVRREVYELAKDKSGKKKVPTKYLSRKFVEGALVELEYEQDKTSTSTEHSENTFTNNDDDKPDCQMADDEDMNSDLNESTERHRANSETLEIDRGSKPKFEEKFKSAWRDKNTEEKFSKQIASALTTSAAPKLIAHICLYLMKNNLNGENVELAIKSIEQYLKKDTPL